MRSRSAQCAALVLALRALGAVPRPGLSEDVPGPEIAGHWLDSRLWQAHFESLVEREVVRGHVGEAAGYTVVNPPSVIVTPM